jgi:double zinc ribbon protein
MARGTFSSFFRRRPAEPESEAPASASDVHGEMSGAAAEAAPEPHAPPQPIRRRPPWHPGELRRERRALARAREERIRDLGGLILEMFRRDRFREDLMREQAEEVFGMEARIQEIDVMLTTTRQQVETTRCECGAPIVWGSHFCANCGRPTGDAVVSCTTCGHPLPADARFCGNCGTQAPDELQQPAEAAPSASTPVTDEASQGSESAADPWER